LAETLATVALINLPLEIQTVFVYFVMAFPAVIVLLFFFVLYFKNTVLYAPSDYSDQSHYLEVNQIKENVSLKMDEIFAEINKSGSRLTQDEINNAKIAMEKSVDKAAKSTLTESALEFLTNNPCTSIEVGEHLYISSMDAFSLLASMERQGLLTNHKDVGANRFTWTVVNV